MNGQAVSVGTGKKYATIASVSRCVMDKLSSSGVINPFVDHLINLFRAPKMLLGDVWNVVKELCG